MIYVRGLYPREDVVAMPINGEPFARVAIDLVGPLPMSGRKHRWILTLVDCNTRYPEAIPMKGIDTIECAEELVNIFCRIGIPQEILSDGGSKFVSDLMREISRLLSVRQLQTTPYHAQCNGLVERWNGTLRRMIQKMAAEKPSDWDRYIPALLFSYREVAQASLGFSPFELVYGRSVRGPMSVLRDIWADEDINEQTNTTYQYVLELIVWSYYVQMMGYWEKLLPSHMWYQEKRTHVLFEMVKSPLRSSLGKKSYCSFCEGPLFGLFGTIVTVAPLSGYTKPDECPSYCLLAYAHNRQRDARLSIKTNIPTSSTLNVMMNYYCIDLIELYSVAIGLY